MTDRRDLRRPVRPTRRPPQTATVPDAADFTKCIADKKQTAPKPAKGQPKPTDAQLKTQCQQEYDQLRDQVLQFLISLEWIEGEANDSGRQGHRQPTSRSSTTSKKQQFAEGGRLPEVPQERRA